MKRSPEIASLSRDHHQALCLAQTLRRATDETAGEARGAALAYWDGHGRAHSGSRRKCCSRPTVTALRELGVELAAHVRLEERELFPLIEESLPAADLAAVAAALEQAEHS